MSGLGEYEIGCVEFSRVCGFGVPLKKFGNFRKAVLIYTPWGYIVISIIWLLKPYIITIIYGILINFS